MHLASRCRYKLGARAFVPASVTGLPVSPRVGAEFHPQVMSVLATQVKQCSELDETVRTLLPRYVQPDLRHFRPVGASDAYRVCQRGLQGWLGESVEPIAEPERAEEGGGWSAAPPGRCPEHEEVGRVRTLYHIPGTGLVH